MFFLRIQHYTRIQDTNIALTFQKNSLLNQYLGAANEIIAALFIMKEHIYTMKVDRHTRFVQMQKITVKHVLDRTLTVLLVKIARHNMWRLSMGSKLQTDLLLKKQHAKLLALMQMIDDHSFLTFTHMLPHCKYTHQIRLYTYNELFFLTAVLIIVRETVAVQLD